MSWLFVGLLVLFFSLGLFGVGVWLYTTSQGNPKRIENSREVIMYGFMGIILSFGFMIYDELTVYKRAPILHDEIVVANTEFVRVEFQGKSTYECVVINKKTNASFTFKSSKRDEAKAFCEKTKIGERYPVTFKDVRGDYYLVKDEK